MSAATIFEQVSHRLVADDAGLEQGKMFSSVGLKNASGKFCAFAMDDDLVVKLPADRVAELIARGEGSVFDAGKGRPMKEWVRLRPPDEEACEAYVLEARDFVSTR